MAPVASALLSLQQLFPDTLVALGTARQIEVSQLSDLVGYAGPRRSNGPDNAQAETCQLASTARRLPIGSGSDIMGNVSWSRKSEQRDKWSFCLTAGKIDPR
ncbi:hypothetical protein, partial [Bradyrhizobium sp. LVM 105]|uniref:hypothetical protein n=1 Tax=Bradyrhizobium sp. LVM 105 TaxID=2341115 RepID=UPI00196A32DF